MLLSAVMENDKQENPPLMQEIDRDIKIVYSGRVEGRFSVTVFEKDKIIIDVHSPVIGEGPYITAWVFSALKPVFLQMPFNSIALEVSLYGGDSLPPEVQELNNFCRTVANSMNLMLQNTNTLLIKHKELKNVVHDQNHDVVLFHMMEGDNRLIGFYNYHKDFFTKRAILKTYESGWNSNTRTWDKRPQVMAPDDFIQYVVDNKVSRLITINYYEPEEFRISHNVHFSAVVHFLGLEWFGVDIDHIECMTFPVLEMFNIESSTRFTPCPSIVKYWFEKAEAKNVNYNPVIQHYEFVTSRHELDDDYGVAVLSNCRFLSVRNDLSLIVYLLGRMKEPLCFIELQIWYFAVRRLIQFELGLRDDLIFNFMKKLYRYMYVASNFLKYEVIDSIKTERHIHIYGDQLWEKLFPQYFKGFLNEQEITEKHRKNKELYLLLNNNFNYLESGGPIFDAIASGVPFISWEAVVKTRPFDGFKYIEYRNATELNRRITDAKANMANAELQNSIRYFKEILKNGEEDIANVFFSNKKISGDSGEYLKNCQEHQVLLDDKIFQYINENKEKLMEDIRVLFMNEHRDVNYKNSVYWDREYFQQLIRISI
ncbi:hypothetical protein D4S03_10325 [bacterium]|nr:MAG: hypothetical protein D4S03_10325 [bacterium]